MDDGRDRWADDHGHLSASDADAGVDDLDHAAMRTSFTVLMSEAAIKGTTAVTAPRGTARAAYI